MPENILRGALTRAAGRLQLARESIHTLAIYYRRPDPDIDDRVDAALEHVTRAKALLDALHDDLVVWEEANRDEESD